MVFGKRGAHVSVPAEWRGKEVEITLIDDPDAGKPITWFEIKKLVVKIVEDKIEEAKGGHR